MLRFRDLGASFSSLGCFVLRSSFWSKDALQSLYVLYIYIVGSMLPNYEKIKQMSSKVE